MIRRVPWQQRDERPVCDCGSKHMVRHTIIVSPRDSKSAYRCSHCQKMLYVYARKWQRQAA